MRRISFPPPQSKNPMNPQGEPWGLVELLQERALGLPENFMSVESCNRVAVLSKKFDALRGMKQLGQCVTVSDSEHEFLSQRLSMGLAVFARSAGGGIPTELLLDVAIYARALHAAEVLPDGDGQVPVAGVLSTLPAGGTA